MLLFTMAVSRQFEWASFSEARARCCMHLLLWPFSAPSGLEEEHPQ